MSRQYVVCVAGLSPDLVKLARTISSKRFVPSGHLVIKPLPDRGYSAAYAEPFIEDAADWIREQKESLPVSIIVLIVGEPGEAFLDRFFPFALCVPVEPIDLKGVSSTKDLNTRRNAFLENIIALSADARKRADAVSHYIKDHHRAAALLPLRNFRAKELVGLMREAFGFVSQGNDVASSLKAHFSTFEKKYETKGKNNDGRCFGDGSHFFASPGRDRHGFLRHNAKGHRHTCILSARSRLGGSYAFDFHFDCQPVRKLDAEYPNCHDGKGEPKATHVNIAPNDFVI